MTRYLNVVAVFILIINIERTFGLKPPHDVKIVGSDLQWKPSNDDTVLYSLQYNPKLKSEDEWLNVSSHIGTKLRTFQITPEFYGAVFRVRTEKGNNVSEWQYSKPVQCVNGIVGGFRGQCGTICLNPSPRHPYSFFPGPQREPSAIQPRRTPSFVVISLPPRLIGFAVGSIHAVIASCPINPMVALISVPPLLLPPSTLLWDTPLAVAWMKSYHPLAHFTFIHTLDFVDRP
ncbi:hypothetical protein F2P79_018142 [Pimephales promelas]|nr:hypothetical protein F2P79_018142 [Pimephales promelas]